MVFGVSNYNRGPRSEDLGFICNGLPLCPKCKDTKSVTTATTVKMLPVGSIGYICTECNVEWKASGSLHIPYSVRRHL